MGRKVNNLSKNIIKSTNPLPIITLFHGDDADLLNEAATQLNYSFSKHLIVNRLERMKLSAARANTPLLTAVQLGIPQAMMVLHRFPRDNQWFSDSYVQP